MWVSTCCSQLFAYECFPCFPEPLPVLRFRPRISADRLRSHCVLAESGLSYSSRQVIQLSRFNRPTGPPLVSSLGSHFYGSVANYSQNVYIFRFLRNIFSLLQNQLTFSVNKALCSLWYWRQKVKVFCPIFTKVFQKGRGNRCIRQLPLKRALTCFLTWKRFSKSLSLLFTKCFHFRFLVRKKSFTCFLT